MTASDPTGAVQHRDGDHRITTTATAAGDVYYNLERFTVCGCVHCDGHWDFVAGSSTPPHAALLADIAAGDDWQWARPNNANIAATRPA